jgi:hypothetical protein
MAPKSRYVRNAVLTDVHLNDITGPQYFTNNAEGTGLAGAVPLVE